MTCLNGYYGENVSIYQGPAESRSANIDASEAMMSYAFGVQGRQVFRVSTLTNPARLVVDIKQ
jgi:hypothetical protein